MKFVVQLTMASLIFSAGIYIGRRAGFDDGRAEGWRACINNLIRNGDLHHDGDKRILKKRKSGQWQACLTS